MIRLALLLALQAITFLALLFIAAASTAWQVNNPKANPMTFWTCFPDVVCFRSLPEFQR